MVEHTIGGLYHDRLTRASVGFLSDLSIEQFADVTGGTLLSYASSADEQKPIGVTYGPDAQVIFNVKAVNKRRHLPKGTHLCRIHHRNDVGKVIGASDHFFRDDSDIEVFEGTTKILTRHESGKGKSWIEIVKGGSVSGGPSSSLM